MSETQSGRLRQIARRAMRDHGLDPDFSPAALGELGRIVGAAPPAADSRDLRSLLWCSIDNDDSRDLDQLTVAAPLPGGGAKLSVAIADVDGLVPKGSALDGHARQNTTSVYTPGTVFPLLPEKLSTDLTSLNPGQDRAAIVAELDLAADGTVVRAELYRALVRNQAQLAYPSVCAWLENRGALPAAALAVPGLPENLRLQDEIAGRLRARRVQHGALELETVRPKPVFEREEIRDLVPETQDRAQRLIEDFMIVANAACARWLEARGFPSLRRVLREPKDWGRLVDFAAEHGGRLPRSPDSAALERFLAGAKAADPAGFPDLSLAVIKMLGRGQYVVQLPGQTVPGHFGLAVDEYSHSSAPNRRYPDLITQRLIKAALMGHPRPPYSPAEIEALAKRCTEMEDAAKKVERQMVKSAAALFLQPRIGQVFQGLVTGCTEGGCWMRVLGGPPVEGKIQGGPSDLRVGNRLKARLVGANPERGFIDFEFAGS